MTISVSSRASGFLCQVGIGFLTALLGFHGAASLQAGEARIDSISFEPVSSTPNLLPNAGFENTTPNGLPQGWAWHRGTTDAIVKIDTTVFHHGSHSLFITNGTAFGPNIYAMLWHEKTVPLTEGHTYTMSAWVKSSNPGVFSLIGGGDWQYRVNPSDTEGQWKRIYKTFKAEKRDCDFTFRINTESETPGIWVDDVKLEENDTPTDDLVGVNDEVAISSNEADNIIQGDGAFQRCFSINTPQSLSGTLTATLGTNPPVQQPCNLKPGLWKVTLRGNSKSMKDTPIQFLLTLTQGNKTTASLHTKLQFFSTVNALERLALLRQRIPALETSLRAVKTTGQDVSYPAISMTVLKNFTGYVEEDANHSEVHRALEQLGELEAMATRLETELKEAQTGRRQFAAVPRWTGEKRGTIKSSAFIAPTRMPDGRIMERPVFFTGYGHFGRVVDEMEKWPDYGCNIIQIEIGPSRVIPADGKTDENASKEMLSILDRAQKSGVAVCLLISPHYFPEWALNKWPHLKVHREGFLNYCLHAPEGRELLKQFIRTLLGPIKDHPALHSICLSNEPVNEEAPCPSGQALWQTWIARQHSSIEELNAVTGSNFTSFAAVSLPDPFGPKPATALWLDFIRFNQEFFADWHQMLADAVHEVAPNLPVHAKAMTWTMINDSDAKWGVDATLFARFSNINGNDSANMFNIGPSEFAENWELNAMSHDLQRSVLDAPIFNTENHIIPDREFRPIPAAHIRSALWQAAIHGQSATTIWVWERTFDAKSDFAGSIMHRPACAEAVGVVAYDLNRVAEAVTSLQQAPPQVLILQSSSAMVWEGPEYNAYSSKLYTALAFSGLKLGFITERQLEAGTVPQTPAVFVPGVMHLSDAACSTLRQYKGLLILAGHGNLLSKDQFGRDRKEGWKADQLAFDHTITTAKLLDLITPRLIDWKLTPFAQTLTAQGKPAWGVECRSTKTSNGILVNVCNYQKKPVTVTLASGGQKRSSIDLLTGREVETSFTLAPMEVRLVRLND